MVSGNTCGHTLHHWSPFFPTENFPCMLRNRGVLSEIKSFFSYTHKLSVAIQAWSMSSWTGEDSHGFLPVATVKQQLITNSRQPWHNIPLPFISWWNLLATFRPIIVNGGGGEPAMREEVNHDAENRERPLLHTGNDQFLGNKQTTTNGWASQLQISSFCARDWGFYQMGQKARTVITEEF